MKTNKYKLFWKKGDVDKNIFCRSFYDDDEYYSFIKRQFDDGYRQIIISSEAMIELIKYCVIVKHLKTYKIEFSEDDSSLSESIDNLLEEIEKRPVLFNNLIDKLLFLSETSSIDISRIYISGRISNGDALDFYIQSNGILAINGSEDDFLNEITNLIKRYLFG